MPLDPHPPSQEELERIGNTMPSEMEWNITDPVMILKFYDLKEGGYYIDSTMVTMEGLEVEHGLKLDGTGRAIRTLPVSMRSRHPAASVPTT